MKGFLVKLISKNTGVSSTRLSLMISIGLAVLVVLTCCWVMIFKNIQDYAGIAAVIGSISVFGGVFGITKAFSDKWQRDNNEIKNS
jgi:hypothetical protein